MAVYSYSGPVESFGRCIESHWSGETRADSEAKARSNLIFQYKMASGRAAGTKISLPGKLVVERRAQ